MRDIKYELQHIILGDGPAGQSGKLKKVQTFLRANAGTGIEIEKKHYFKREKAAAPYFLALITTSGFFSRLTALIG